MLAQNERNKFLQKLKEVAKVYSDKAIVLGEGLEKDLLSKLATEINLSYDNFTEEFEIDGNKYNVNSIEFSSYFSLYCQHKLKSQYMTYFCHSFATFPFELINDVQADCLAEVFYADFVGVIFSVNGLRSFQEMSIAKGIEVIEESLSFKPLGVPYLTPELEAILQKALVEREKNAKIKDWGKLFDFQTNYNYVLTTCRQIEIALKHSDDEKVKDFIFHLVMNEGIKKVLEFEKTLKDPNISQELRTHLEYTVKRCNEVIEKTLGYQKIAISEISRLFKGRTISKDDAGAIAFLTFKKLKEDGKLNGIEGINVEEVGRALEGVDVDKKFITDIFTKVKKRAAAEKTDSTIEKVVLTIEEFLLTLWYAVKLYLCRNKDERQDINKTSDWASFLAESRSSDVAAGVRRSDL